MNLKQNKWIKSIKNSKNSVVLDVRTPKEFEEGFIRNSINNTIYQFDPSLELNKTQYRLNIGVRPTIANGDFALYPKIEITKKNCLFLFLL